MLCNSNPTCLFPERDIKFPQLARNAKNMLVFWCVLQGTLLLQRPLLLYQASRIVSQFPRNGERIRRVLSRMCSSTYHHHNKQWKNQQQHSFVQRKHWSYSENCFEQLWYHTISLNSPLHGRSGQKIDLTQKVSKTTSNYLSFKTTAKLVAQTI